MSSLAPTISRIIEEERRFRDLTVYLEIIKEEDLAIITESDLVDLFESAEKKYLAKILYRVHLAPTVKQSTPPIDPPVIEKPRRTEQPGDVRLELGDSFNQRGFDASFLSDCGESTRLSKPTSTSETLKEEFDIYVRTLNTLALDSNGWITLPKPYVCIFKEFPDIGYADILRNVFTTQASVKKLRLSAPVHRATEVEAIFKVLNDCNIRLDVIEFPEGCWFVDGEDPTPAWSAIEKLLDQVKLVVMPGCAEVPRTAPADKCSWMNGLVWLEKDHVSFAGFRDTLVRQYGEDGANTILRTHQSWWDRQ